MNTTPFVQNEMELSQHADLEVDGDSKMRRRFMEDQKFMSAPEGGANQEGPLKISGNEFQNLHAVDKDALELLPELENKELPNNMWGMGIMTILIDLEDMLMVTTTSGKFGHLVRLLYVVLCGILNLFVQASVPAFLVHSQLPLIPSWAVNPFDPIKADYSLVPFKTMTTLKPPPTHKHHDPDYKAPPTTTLGPLDALEHVQVAVDHHAVPSPTDEGDQLCAHGGFEVPCGHIGKFLGLFLFLWLAQTFRQIAKALDLAWFVFNMPKVNAEYSNLNETAYPGPSKCNHIIARKGKNEVYAITFCSKFLIVSLMLFKVVFHLAIGLYGARALMMTTSTTDLMVTFLVLWFMGVVLPPFMLESLLPWAVNDVAVTKFACLDAPGTAQNYSVKWMMLSAVFAFFTFGVAILAMTKYSPHKVM